MILALLLNNILDIFGIIYICLAVWKVARGYGFRRAFF